MDRDLQAARDLATALAVRAGQAAGRLDGDRLDGGLALDTKLWDIAAGALIAREAGVTLGGRGPDHTTELAIGAAPALWPDLAKLIRTAG